MEFGSIETVDEFVMEVSGLAVREGMPPRSW
jgi:hypothetical protein